MNSLEAKGEHNYTIDEMTLMLLNHLSPHIPLKVRKNKPFGYKVWL